MAGRSVSAGGRQAPDAATVRSVVPKRRGSAHRIASGVGPDAAPGKVRGGQDSGPQVSRKETRLKLVWKFNLVLLGIFVIGFAIAGYVSHTVLQNNAREEILQHGRLMMEAA